MGSGLSQNACCMREDLKPNTFSSWKKVIQRRDQEKSAKTETDSIPVFMPTTQKLFHSTEPPAGALFA
ncbi:MAG: hypothetical protein LCH63_14605 [Candidatus Melainabacteria bacterium]|nr:hypothetical protein [Candidatus Melainabacteria bacterium]